MTDFATAAEVFALAADQLTVTGELDDMPPEQVLAALRSIREGVATAGKVDAIICGHLYRTHYGSHEHAGIGLVTVRRTATRVRWEERAASYAMLDARIRELDGEYPDPAVVVDWVLELLGVSYVRKGALRAVGLDPDDYFTSEPGNPAVDFGR